MKHLTDEQEDILINIFKGWSDKEITEYLNWLGDFIDPFVVADIYTDEFCSYDPIITEFNDRAMDYNECD